MRLCWNQGFRGPLRDMKPEEAKAYYDMGFRVVGFQSSDVDAADADINRAKRILDDNGLMPGPYWIRDSNFHSDPVKCKEYKEKAIKALRIAGKIGCTSLRFSVGNMNTDNVWRHHPENHTQKALDMLIEKTKEIVPAAEDERCMICPETNQWTIVGTIKRMKEYVDRLDSPYARVVFDPVNYMTPERIYQSGRFVKCTIAYLGDRIGVLHVKDTQIMDGMVNIGEVPMGTGVFDYEAFIKASVNLEGWKTFSLEHIRDMDLIKKAHDHIQGIADRIGHKWTDPKCTRERWEKGECKKG